MTLNYLFGSSINMEPGRTVAAREPLGSGKADSSDVRYLEDRVDRLSLICMAMWSLMRDKTGVTEEELLERVKLLDLMDGQEDGKATRTVSQCTRCDRPMNARHKKCMYCGHDKLIQSAFDAL